MGGAGTCLPRLDATVVTLGLLACQPIIFGASQIYPDLPAGVAALALASWLWGSKPARLHRVVHVLVRRRIALLAPREVLRANRGVGGTRCQATVARREPAVHSRKLLDIGILYLAGPALFWDVLPPPIWRPDRWARDGRAEFRLPERARTFPGPALRSGARTVHPATAPAARSRCAGLDDPASASPDASLARAVLSLIVPNALQQVPYGGHVAPAGPVRLVGNVALARSPRDCHPGIAERHIIRGGRTVDRVFGVAYQAILALQWVPMPQRLFNGLLPADVWQPSLFADGVMLSLPKFGPHADVSHPPNTVWVLGALSLLAAGFIQQSRFRYLPAAATAILALFLLPAEDTLDRARTVPRRYEAENTPARCTVLTRRMASNGRICQQNANHLFAVNGPYVALEPGRYRVVAALHPGVRTLPGRGVLDVVGNRGYTAITRHSFRLMPTTHWTYLGVDFNIARTFRDVEFRIRGFRGLEVDYVEVHSIP